MEQRIAALVDFYRMVEIERMQGVPILNPMLCVEALGFCLIDDEPSVAQGVLITPWFMSLLRLPLVMQDHGGRVGHKRVQNFGNERFDFIGAYDPALGFHEACALFSPMANFLSQEQARQTAQAVLGLLRPTPAAATVVAPMPARRAFFLARRSGVSS